MLIICSKLPLVAYNSVYVKYIYLVWINIVQLTCIVNYLTDILTEFISHPNAQTCFR